MRDQIIAGAIGAGFVMIANFLLNWVKNGWDKQASVRQQLRVLHIERANNVHEVIGCLIEYLECSDQATGCAGALKLDSGIDTLPSHSRDSLSLMHREMFFRAKSLKWRCIVLAEKFGELPIQLPERNDILLAQAMGFLFDQHLEILLSESTSSQYRNVATELVVKVIRELREIAKHERVEATRKDFRKNRHVKSESIRELLRLQSGYSKH